MHHISDIMNDMLAQRRERKAGSGYKPKHGAGVETQREMELAAAKQRHPSAYVPKHGPHVHDFTILGADKGTPIKRCACGHIEEA